MPLWHDAGLFSPEFNFKSVANAIPLCPLCHRQFDKAEDPGFVFFPSDLNFFIEFELRDKDQRENTNVRQVPNAVAYRNYQISSKAIPSNAIGGLYTRVFLKVIGTES